MYFFIYKTTNLINNKMYVGKRKSKEINDGYLGSGVVIKSAIEKYGKEHFKREILEFCSSYEESNEKEKYWIKKLNCVNDENYYNLRDGGDGGKLSEQSIEKMKKTKKENPFIPDENYRKKISKLHKGRKRKRSTCEKISKSNKGKRHSNETIDKISKSKKEYYKSNNHPLKGKNLTEGVKVKISKKVRENWSKSELRVVYSNSAKKRKKVKCPFCNDKVDISTSKKFHFENCLKNPNVDINKRSQPKLKGRKVSQETVNKIKKTMASRSLIKCKYCNFEHNNMGILNRWHNNNCKNKPI